MKIIAKDKDVPIDLTIHMTGDEAMELYREMRQAFQNRMMYRSPFFNELEVVLQSKGIR